MTDTEYANSDLEYADIYEQRTIEHVVEAVAVLMGPDGRAIRVPVKFDGLNGNVHLTEVVSEQVALFLFTSDQFYADLVELYRVNRELGTFISGAN